MKANTSVLLAGIAFVLLAGCQKTSETTPASNDPTPGSSPAVSAAPPGGSVAAPSAPASDAAIPPATAGSSSGASGSGDQGSGDANSPTQANPAALSKQEEEKTMPQTGQVNNHSAPDAAGTQGTPTPDK